MDDQTLNYFSTCNYDYLEIILITEEDNYDIPENTFNDLLCKLKSDTNSSYKYFQCDTKEYHNRQMLLLKKIKDNDVIETKAYQMKLVDVHDTIVCQQKLRILKNEKKKVSTIIFPSAKQYDNIVFKRRLIFRVNNKVYINFQIEKIAEDGSNVRRKIYINFNNSKDTDMNDISDNINAVLTTLLR